MLFFKFLQREVCSSLVVTHVVVPCLRELQELSFLSCFDILQFLLLGSPDIVFLTNGLLAQKLVELAASLLGFLVVTFDLAFLSILLEQAEEIKDLVVCRYVNDSVRRRLSNEILPVQIVRIIFRELVLFKLFE